MKNFINTIMLVSLTSIWMQQASAQQPIANATLNVTIDDHALKQAISDAVGGAVGVQTRSLLTMAIGGGLVILGASCMLFIPTPENSTADTKPNLGGAVAAIGATLFAGGYLENRGVIDSWIRYFSSPNSPFKPT